jgi:hypothetical protein
MRGPDDDGVSGTSRRGVQTNLASHEVHRLIVIQLEIDDSTSAEARDRITGFCVERDEAVARRDVENPFFAAVGPVRQAASRELPWGCRAAITLVLAVHPQELAVAASSAMTDRRVLAVSRRRRGHGGVDSTAFGQGPGCCLNRQAISSLLKLPR